MGSYSRRRAFTIFEVLIVIALIAMLTAVLVTGAIHLTRNTAITPDDIFWKAVSETRRMALLSGREVRLSYSDKDKEHVLVARGMDGAEQRFSFDGQSEVIIDFLSTQKGGSSMLLAGQLVETQTLPYVTFYGDGTCSPFRVQMRTGRAGTPHTLMIDPWTCAMVLNANTEK